jgi:hypothetical protein
MPLSQYGKLKSAEEQLQKIEKFRQGRETL